MCLGEFPDMLILESIDATAPDLSNTADIMQLVEDGESGNYFLDKRPSLSLYLCRKQLLSISVLHTVECGILQLG